MGEFQNLFQQAAEIKSKQLKEIRKNFEKLPKFSKAGLYLWQELIPIRQKPLSEQLQFLQDMNDEGNEFSKKQEFLDATQKYQRGICLFVYITSVLEDWKKDGIKDEDLSYHNDVEKYSFDDQQLIKQKLLPLYLNLAMCYLEQKEYKNAIFASDQALLIDCQNVKALYRRGKARADNIQTELILAAKDLKSSYSFSNGNAQILDYYNKVVQMIKKYNTDQASMVGFFNKVENKKSYEEAKEVQQNQTQEIKNEKVQQDKQQFQNKEEEQIIKEINYKNNLQRMINSDINDPVNKDLVQFAENIGLNPNDERTQKLLKNIQKKNVKSMMEKMKEEKKVSKDFDIKFNTKDKEFMLQKQILNSLKDEKWDKVFFLIFIFVLLIQTIKVKIITIKDNIMNEQ